MPDLYLARQPIYDAHLQVVGYELLFRDGSGTNARVNDAEAATSHVILSGLDIGLEELLGDRPAFINVSRRFLVDGYALVLPAERVVLELLEDRLVDDELVAAVRDLRERGYTVALDDFSYSEAERPLLDAVDIVKVDVLGRTPEEVEAEFDRLAPLDKRLVAEKIETYEAYEHCWELGFDCFQGYFFCRPKTFRKPGIPTGRLARMRLIARLHEPSVEFGELERIVSADVGLGYRLLRHINSDFFGLRQPVSSLRHALGLLGLEELKRWVTLVTFSGVEDKPGELLVTALTRGRMCELLAGDAPAAERDTSFTAGMLSTVDAFLDMPLDEVVGGLRLSDDLKTALLGHAGPAGERLRCAIAYERGDLLRARAKAPPRVDLSALYLKALAWAGEASGALLAAGAQPAAATP